MLMGLVQAILLLRNLSGEAIFPDDRSRSLRSSGQRVGSFALRRGHSLCRRCVRQEMLKPPGIPDRKMRRAGVGHD